MKKNKFNIKDTICGLRCKDTRYESVCSLRGLITVAISVAVGLMAVFWLFKKIARFHGFFWYLWAALSWCCKWIAILFVIALLVGFCYVLIVSGYNFISPHGAMAPYMWLTNRKVANVEIGDISEFEDSNSNVDTDLEGLDLDFDFNTLFNEEEDNDIDIDFDYDEDNNYEFEDRNDDDHGVGDFSEFE